MSVWKSYSISRPQKVFQAINSKSEKYWSETTVDSRSRRSSSEVMSILTPICVLIVAFTATSWAFSCQGKFIWTFGQRAVHSLIVWPDVHWKFKNLWKKLFKIQGVIKKFYKNLFSFLRTLMLFLWEQKKVILKQSRNLRINLQLQKRLVTVQWY